MMTAAELEAEIADLKKQLAEAREEIDWLQARPRLVELANKANTERDQARAELQAAKAKIASLEELISRAWDFTDHHLMCSFFDLRSQDANCNCGLHKLQADADAIFGNVGNVGENV